jgi:hypothetical protein
LEIEDIDTKFGLSSDRIEALCYASKMSAKVDNATIQAGYLLRGLAHRNRLTSKESLWLSLGKCRRKPTVQRLSEPTPKGIAEERRGPYES